MDASRTLVCIEVTTPTAVWNRTILSDYVPTPSELAVYYGTLLGLGDVSVTVNTETVPVAFNVHLLATLDSAPNKFPVHDLETEPKNTEKRQQYKSYIKQVCDMERSRIALQVFTPAEAPTPPHPTTFKPKTPAWVEELLRSLNTDHEYEEEAQHATDEIVSGLYENFAPAGWIFTPTAAAVRAKYGSRIVTDQDIGKQWERLLSTDLYPDLVVSRRITTANWAFQHPTSDALVKSTIEWYMASKDTKPDAKISSWIPNAETEVNSLLSTFKKIKINERLILESNKPNDKTAQMFKILNAVESQLLVLPMDDTNAEPLTTDIYQKYIHYVFRGFGIPKELYGPNEAVNQSVERWGRSGFGFKPTADPLLESWKSMWHAAIRGKATRDRVINFLRTLDAWDPVESTLFSTQHKAAIAAEWIKAFLDTETHMEDKAKLHSLSLYKFCKDWCFKFVPETLFTTSISPMTIGPILKYSRGLDSKKKAGGRYFEGIRMKNSVEGTVTETTAALMETSDGVSAERHNIFQVVTSDGDRVEHFFCSSSTTTTIELKV